MTREEIALIEVGHTDVSTPVKWFLLAAFFIIMCSVPVLDQAHCLLAPAKGDSPRLPVMALSKIIPTRADILADVRERGAFGGLLRVNANSLREIHKYEDTLSDSSEFARVVLPHMQSLLVGHLKSGNEKVYCGRDGWLFYRPGIDYLTGPGFLEPVVLAARARSGNEWNPPPQPDPLKAIVEFRDQLAGRGIELVLFPAPTKAMLHPERFSSRYDGTVAPQNPSYPAFLASLSELGVRIYDPTQTMLVAKLESGNDVFLASDTHWTPDGLEAAAKGLASYLEQNSLAKPGPADYRTQDPRLANLGDIAAMLRLPSDQAFYPEETVAARQVAHANGSPWRPDRASSILLLGDSYSNIYSLAAMGWGEGAGLAERLGAITGLPVDTLIINDNGAFATRQAIDRELARGVDRLAGKKVVVWEFAMRELAVGDWKTGLDMKVGEATPSPTATTPDGELQLEGTITALTRPPKPGTVPYKDCIIALHITQASCAQIGLGVDEVVVFAYGMRDNELTEAARFEKGQRVRFTVVPWSSVEQTHGSLNRAELDDERTLLMDIYWAVLQGDEAPPCAEDKPLAEANTTQGRPSVEPVVDEAPESTDTWSDKLAKAVAELEQSDKNVFRGKDGWLFFTPELRHLTVGQFWGERAKEVSRASNPAHADPLAAIVDFNEQLESVGIELLLVPVPPKASVHTEAALAEAGDAPEPAFEEFYKVLAENNVDVLDLLPAFRDGDDPAGYYCKQDTHWNGAACERTAALIAEWVRTRADLSDIPSRVYKTEAYDTEITGDLWRYLGDESLPKETVALKRVLDENGDSPGDSRESPVLLLSDSHGLVFHEGGDMFATDSGLADHLAKELGFPVDLLGVRGSGATPARMSLLRRRDGLSGKQVVIWCFTAREFTEAQGGWRKLPVVKQTDKGQSGGDDS